MAAAPTPIVVLHERQAVQQPLGSFVVPTVLGSSIDLTEQGVVLRGEPGTLVGREANVGGLGGRVFYRIDG